MKVKIKATGKLIDIYGVRKSGPSNSGSHTKFLVYIGSSSIGEWVWMPCDRFIAC